MGIALWWTRFGRGSALLAGLVAACTAAPSSVGREQSPLFREIALLEDARDTGGHRLASFMRHPDPDLRLRAATALGRMPYPECGAEVTDALLAGLADGDQRVRAESAFALGLRGDPRAGAELVELAGDRAYRDPLPLVRARAVEAASKLACPELRVELLEALRDESSLVRLEAAEGAHRWAREEPSAAAVDQALLDHLNFEGERDVLAMTLFSLQRREVPQALAAFLDYAGSRQPSERLWAVRGLAELGPDERARKALVLATRDPDWRVAYEATLALGGYDLGVEVAALVAASEHRRPHVRRAAWEALAQRLARVKSPEELEQGAKAWKVAFDELLPRGDPSLGVRAAFGAALVLYERLAGAPVPALGAAEARLSSGTTSAEEWVAYATAVAQDLPGAGAPDQAAEEILMLLARQADARVAGAALEALGQIGGERARRFLHEALAHEDNGRRLAAVLALREMPDPSDVEPLAAAYQSSTGDVAAEVRFNALRNLGVLGGERTRALLLEGLGDRDPFVRRVAREELEKHWPGPAVASADAGEPLALQSEVPWPGQEHALYRRNPRVRISTSRGDMVFELFPREAPVHVHNFLALAERGRYDGTIFHRVVPDFVIQGGDYRGDGNGGTTFRGADALRHEIGPRKYVRGSLGMPRNEDLDSGGSQFFVTHRPTPHLDGRYTIFGELRAGFEVLDAIEVGDRIVEVRRITAR